MSGVELAAKFVSHFVIGGLHNCIRAAAHIEKTSAFDQRLAAFIQAVNEIRLRVAFDFDQKFQEHSFILPRAKAGNFTRPIAETTVRELRRNHRHVRRELPRRRPGWNRACSVRRR